MGPRPAPDTRPERVRHLVTGHDPLVSGTSLPSSSSPHYVCGWL